jgi:hypothetical protein
MAKEHAKNIAASVRARLLNVAKKVVGILMRFCSSIFRSVSSTDCRYLPIGNN